MGREKVCVLVLGAVFVADRACTSACLAEIIDLVILLCLCVWPRTWGGSIFAVARRTDLWTANNFRMRHS